MDGLEKEIQKVINQRNNSPVKDFSGYTPNEMTTILYDPFHENSPIQICKVEQEIYNQVPLLLQIKYLLKIIEEQGELKLTEYGNLPKKVVFEIYEQGFIKDYAIETGISKLHKEGSVPAIHLTKILVELSRMVKKRNNRLSLTKLGKEKIANNSFIFQDLFKNFTTRFNWAYFDAYSDLHAGQFGFGYTLALFSLYGRTPRSTDFYSEKYTTAFGNNVQPDTNRLFDASASAYEIRTFERFLDYFGFTEYDEGKKDVLVKASSTFFELINIRHPIMTKKT